MLALLHCFAALVLGLCCSAQTTTGGYLVVELGLDRGTSEFATAARDVAEEAAAFHRGSVVVFDGLDWEAWQATLRELRPQQVLFVVPSEVLDVPLHRRILLGSAALDADPLPDFRWGYLTARGAEGLRELWQRTLQVHENGLAGKIWYDCAVTSGMKSAVYRGSVPTLAKAAGFAGDSIYFATVDQDAKNLEFVDQQLPRLEEASVVEFTGNGDPEGIWLFPGKRNLDRSLHWAYDAKRVGEDPDGVMPRVTAERFRSLALTAPVVWSGTCHSAATRRVFVEGDIVSTFGRTDRATLHLLPEERSMCLSILEAGAVAFLAPLGANHGMAVSRERDAALRRGCTLGEAIGTTYDDVFLAAGGPPELDIPVEGEPHLRGEPVMQGGGSNRILIGDPALAPFTATAHPGETTRVTEVEDGLRVEVEWAKGWHPMAWDMFGTVRGADWRIVARVELARGQLSRVEPGPLPEGRVKVLVRGEDEKDMPHTLRHAVLELTPDGKRVLHLQANAPRKGVERVATWATFDVRD